MSTPLCMSELKVQALLANQPKKSFAIQKSIASFEQSQCETAYWLLMIRDLIEGAGYNYSRIATQVGVCPSTIQKLITHPSRRPRQALFEKLLVLYHKVFHGPYPTLRAQTYLERRPVDVLAHLPKAWIKNLIASIDA